MTPPANLGKASSKRISIFQRDGGKCYICDVPLTVETMSLDHQIPRFAGGGATKENLKCSCYKCNNNKSCIESLLAEKRFTNGGIPPNLQSKVVKAYSYYYKIVRRKYNVS